MAGQEKLGKVVRKKVGHETGKDNTRKGPVESELEPRE